VLRPLLLRTFHHFSFNSCLLLLAVLAGLPHLDATAAILSHNPCLLNAPMSQRWNMNGDLSMTQFSPFLPGLRWLRCRLSQNKFSIISLADLSHISSCKPTPSGNQHACSRLLPTSLWLINRGTGHLHTHPRCTLWESALCLGLLKFFAVALLVFTYIQQLTKRHPLPFVADWRATARTMETLSQAATSQKSSDTLDFSTSILSGVFFAS